MTDTYQFQIGKQVLNFLKRDDRQGDINVLNEVVRDDAYGIQWLKSKGYVVDLFVDVGAHVGSASCVVCSLWPDAKVIAIEPDSENAEMCFLNMSRNGFGSRLRLIRAGLSYVSEKNVLWAPDKIHGEVTGGAFIGFNSGPSEDLHTYQYRHQKGVVRTVKLEDVVDQKVDLLKLDCEGGEIDFFACSSVPMRELVGVIVGEFHAAKGHDWFVDLVETSFPGRRLKTNPMASENGRLGSFSVFPIDFQEGGV